MKIWWIVNSVLNTLSEHLYHTPGNGVWMDALLTDYRNNPSSDIVVITTLPLKERVRLVDGNITYYALPTQYPILYDENNPRNIAQWEQLLKEEKPDLIMVWGTEFTHGLCALRLAKDIPSVIYMQGYVGSIARHYLAGLTHKEIKKNITFRDAVKRDSILQQQQHYYRATEKEKEMFRLSGRIICENDWCADGVRAVAPSVEVYRCPLSINTVFARQEWKIENTEKHSLICTASGYPLKGLHMVLRAVALLKTEYPDIKLYIPGPKVISDGSLEWTIRKNGYTQYMERLIKELNIADRLVWMGEVPQQTLAEQYAKTRVFVLSSSIENHSSSLKEAMMVGVPSIASFVGGVPEYVRHGENGFLYRFEEYDIMATYIRRLFEDDALAEQFSRRGKEELRSIHGNTDVTATMTDIFEQIIG